jgi:hypothetical protein
MLDRGRRMLEAHLFEDAGAQARCTAEGCGI